MAPPTAPSCPFPSLFSGSDLLIKMRPEADNSPAPNHCHDSRSHLILQLWYCNSLLTGPSTFSPGSPQSLFRTAATAIPLKTQVTKYHSSALQSPLLASPSNSKVLMLTCDTPCDLPISPACPSYCSSHLPTRAFMQMFPLLRPPHICTTFPSLPSELISFHTSERPSFLHNHI